MAARLIPQCLPRCTAAAAAPRASIRRGYASASSASGSSITTILQVLAGTGVLAAGYGWYAAGAPTDPKELKELEGKLETKAKQVVGMGSIEPLKSGETTTDASNSALDPNEFRDFKLAKVIPYNHNSSRFVFDLPEGTDSGLKVASCLVTKASDSSVKDDKGKDVIRPYTTVTSPSEKGKLELLVKKYQKGLMTNHIFNLKVGDTLAMKGPIPNIAYTPNEYEHIGMIMGGSGITPGYQVMQAIDNNPEDKTKVTLLFSNVTEEDILLRKEFEAMQKRKPDQFKVVFTLDKPPSGWKGPSGFLTADVLGKNLPPAGLADKIKIMVCGPPPMYNAISGPKKSPKDQGELKGLLADLGYTADQVFKF